jgi:hypothetical protein
MVVQLVIYLVFSLPLYHSFNAQQMVAQLVIYLVFSLPLYHSSQTFQFINIFPF